MKLSSQATVPANSPTRRYGSCTAARGEMSNLEIRYSLPGDVIVIDGRLMRNPEIGDDCPEWLYCVAKTKKGTRCKNMAQLTAR